MNINPGCGHCNIRFPVVATRVVYVCAGNWQHGFGDDGGRMNITDKTSGAMVKGASGALMETS